jgi:hypothetical protein
MVSTEAERRQDGANQAKGAKKANGVTVHGLERPLVLQHLNSGARVSIPVPSDHHTWTVADVAREAFASFLETDEDVELSLVGEDFSDVDDDEAKSEQRRKAAKAERDLLLFAHFLHFVVSSQRLQDVHLLSTCFAHFVRLYLVPQNIDVHTLVSTLDIDKQRIVLRAFYEARETVHATGRATPREPVSRLFGTDSDGVRSKEIYALFGGQGTPNETYFDEFRVRFLSSVIPDLRVDLHLLVALRSLRPSSHPSSRSCFRPPVETRI